MAAQADYYTMEDRCGEHIELAQEHSRLRRQGADSTANSTANSTALPCTAPGTSSSSSCTSSSQVNTLMQAAVKHFTTFQDTMRRGSCLSVLRLMP